MASSPEAEAASSNKPRSCTNCRRRKIKCDLVRPKCGACSRSVIFEDCEYNEEGLTRIQFLQEQISIVEARIEQLENPLSSARTLTLHHPYQDGKRRASSLPLLSRSGTDSSSSGHVGLPAHSDAYLSATPQLPEKAVPSELGQDIPPGEMDALVDNFLTHSSQFGFFLHVQSFRDAMLGSTPGIGAGSGSGYPTPTPFLRDVVCLWAVHLANSNSNADLNLPGPQSGQSTPPAQAQAYAQESAFLAHALRSAADAFAPSNSTRTRNRVGRGHDHDERTGTGPHTADILVLHAIQAEILLAHYFLRNVRFLEGKYHLSAAVGLVLSAGMHRRAFVPLEVDSGSNLSLGLGAIQRAERVRAFWTVLTTNNCWTTADGSPSNFSYAAPDVRIDAPWPADINEPGGIENQIEDEETLEPESSSAAGIGTVNAFLTSLSDARVGTSVAALHAKASILFEQAARLASQYRPDMRPEELNTFLLGFTSMDSLIDQFHLGLEAGTEGHDDDYDRENMHARELLLTRVLTRVATIQLHNPFVGDPEIDVSRLRVLKAARGVVEDVQRAGIDEAKWEFMDPIMGTLLMATCQVFIAALARNRGTELQGSAAPADALIRDAASSTQALRKAVEDVLATMAAFAPSCRLMDSQLNTMRTAYRASLSS